MYILVYASQINAFFSHLTAASGLRDGKNVADYAWERIHQQPVNVSSTTEPNICIWDMARVKEDFQISIHFPIYLGRRVLLNLLKSLKWNIIRSSCWLLKKWNKRYLICLAIVLPCLREPKPSFKELWKEIHFLLLFAAIGDEFIQLCKKFLFIKMILIAGRSFHLSFFLLILFA